MKQKETLSIHPKYRIAELLRNQYGELNFKKAVAEFSDFCNLRNERTVTQWLNIPQGSTKSISFHLMPRVLHFFKLSEECDLFTGAHLETLKTACHA